MNSLIKRFHKILSLPAYFLVSKWRLISIFIKIGYSSCLYVSFISSPVLISKGIRCSRTDFLMKMLIAVDMLIPVELQNSSNSFFKFSSKRIQIVVCVMIDAPMYYQRTSK